MKDQKKDLTPREADPDFKIKKIEEASEDAAPRIFKIARRGKQNPAKDRREFLKDAALGMTGFLGLGGLLSSCEKESEIELQCDDEHCTCHVVCTCDVVKEDERSEHSSNWRSTYQQNVCTCDEVCTCNTHCTCNTVSTCTCDTQGGGGGGGGSYWYPN